MSSGKKLLEHYYTSQPFSKILEGYTHYSGIKHPSCGDILAVMLLIEYNRLIKIGYQAKGCMLSQAVASLLAEICIDQSVDFVASLTGNTIQERIGLALGPVRFKCALLALHAFQQACNNPV